MQLVRKSFKASLIQIIVMSLCIDSMDSLGLIGKAAVVNSTQFNSIQGLSSPAFGGVFDCGGCVPQRSNVAAAAVVAPVSAACLRAGSVCERAWLWPLIVTLPSV